MLSALLITGLPAHPIIMGGLLAAVVSWITGSRLRHRHRLRVRGWVACREGRDDVAYSEWVEGNVRRLTIIGELGTPHAVYIPSDDAWERTVPEWARGRRTEIIDRVKADLGSKHYEFVDDNGAA
jgi:hypothetical protein